MLKIKKSSMYFLLALILSVSACAHPAVDQKIADIPEGSFAWKVNWVPLDEGLVIAFDEGKPLLIEFAVHEGCPRCELMQKHVYSNANITDKINKEFIPVFINLANPLSPNERELGEKHDYHEDCLLVFLDYKGEPVFEAGNGKMCYKDPTDPEVFIKYLDYVISTYGKDK